MLVCVCDVAHVRVVGRVEGSKVPASWACTDVCGKKEEVEFPLEKVRQNFVQPLAHHPLLLFSEVVLISISENE